MGVGYTVYPNSPQSWLSVSIAGAILGGGLLRRRRARVDAGDVSIAGAILGGGLR